MGIDRPKKEDFMVIKTAKGFGTTWNYSELDNEAYQEALELYINRLECSNDFYEKNFDILTRMFIREHKKGNDYSFKWRKANEALDRACEMIVTTVQVDYDDFENSCPFNKKMSRNYDPVL